MAVRATSIKHGGIDIEISPRADPDSQAVMAELYQNCHAGMLECREHDDERQLAHLRDPADGRVHGAWVYLQKRNDVWVICHMPFGASGIRLRDHKVRVMTDQHRWQQDYWERAGQDAGYSTGQEVRVGGNRLDVAITAPDGYTVGIEVQHSILPLKQVHRRDKKAGAVGIPLVWSADRRHSELAYKVAHVETAELPHKTTPRDTWTVVGGPRKMRVERCRPLNFDTCPVPGSRGRHCDGWHPRWEPYPGLTVDRVAELAPARELLRVDTHSPQGIVMLDAADHRRYVDELEPDLVGAHEASGGPGTSNACDYYIDPARMPRPRTEQEPAEDLTRPATVVDRLTAAGLSPDRIAWWLARGDVRVDGRPVTDPGTSAARPARVVLRTKGARASAHSGSSLPGARRRIR